MHRFASAVALTVSGVILGTIVAFADHAEPKKARVLEGRFVTAYEPCETPNTEFEGALVACMPPVRSDPVCGFGPKGRGKFKLFGKFDEHGLVKFKATLAGLDPACQGETLTFELGGSRFTGHNCGGEACTFIDGASGSYIDACIVDTRNRCKTGLLSQIIIGFPSPVFGQVEIFDFAIQVRRDSTGFRTFAAGILFREP